MLELVPILPHLQAALNATTVCLLGVAYYHIRQGDRAMHRRFMLLALGVSALFMVSYLIYHSQVGNVKFAGEGLIRPIYFTILATHVLLAALIVPLVLVTVFNALRQNFQRHRRIARWTLPLWIYVCLSGIVVYALAFHLYPAQAGLA